MQQDILFFNNIENVLFLLQRCRHDRRDWPLFQVGPVQTIKLHQVGNINKTLDTFDLFCGEPSSGGEQLDHLFGHSRCHL